MTVYIVQESPGKNLVPAQKYGELELLLPARTNLMLSTGPEVLKLKRKLSDFNDEDYLLLVGSNRFMLCYRSIRKRTVFSFEVG
jgi:hypothetical protein